MASRRERREARLREIMQDASGNVVYTGDLWKIADSEKAGNGTKQRIILIACLAALTAIVVGSGCIDAMNARGSFFVVLPYIGEVSALFGLAWSAVKVLAPSDGVRTYNLEYARPRIAGASRILTVFALTGLLFSAVYMIRHGAGDRTADGMAYLMLKAAAAALAEWYARRFASVNWEKK